VFAAVVRRDLDHLAVPVDPGLVEVRDLAAAHPEAATKDEDSGALRLERFRQLVGGFEQAFERRFVHGVLFGVSGHWTHTRTRR